MVDANNPDIVTRDISGLYLSENKIEEIRKGATFQTQNEFCSAEAEPKVEPTAQETLAEAQVEWKRQWYHDKREYRVQEKKNGVDKEKRAKFYDADAESNDFMREVEAASIQSKKCGIFYEDLNTGKPRQLPCGHLFHPDCLRMYFEKRESAEKCPNCSRGWTIIRKPEWNFPRYKYFNQNIPGEQSGQIRVQVGGFKQSGTELTSYEKRHCAETPGGLAECRDWVMGYIPNSWQKPIVPRAKKQIVKSDLTGTENSAQVNPSMQGNEVYIGMNEASPNFLATRRPRRPGNREHSLNSHHCQTNPDHVQGEKTKKSSEGKLESDSPLARAAQESSRFKENFLNSDYKAVASPLAEEENASTDVGAQDKTH